MFAVFANFCVTHWTLSVYPGVGLVISHGRGITDLPAGELSLSLSGQCLGKGKTVPYEWNWNWMFGNKSSWAAVGSFPQKGCSEISYKTSWLICYCYQVLKITAKRVLGNDNSYKSLKHLGRHLIFSVSSFFFLKQIYHLHFDFSSNISLKILIYQLSFSKKKKAATINIDMNFRHVAIITTVICAIVDLILLCPRKFL